MLLDVRFLTDCTGVNAWSYASDPPSWYEGDTQVVYFQLVDQHAGCTDGPGQGRRYMPAAGATLTVLFDSLDGARAVTKVATQPFAQDPSIWKVDIATNDTIRGTVDLIVTLTEGSVVHRARLRGGVRVRSTTRS